jgi:beta-lactamase regulating signal transducer with metallopeptidase domain
MTLSYAPRLLCVLIIAVGFVLAASQIVLALAAPWILGDLDTLTARSRERILYSLQIGPALFAVFVTGAICLPAYLRGEANLESESVSGLCLLVAAVVTFWFGSAVLRGLRITVRTVRFARACHRSGRVLTHGSDIPVLEIPDPGRPVCLIGFFRPLILVSSSLTSTASGTFDLALAHERSHADHRDNWKLLTLRFLPRFDRLLPGGDPWSRPWQKAADWAADDDAVRGEATRSLLLAEALVTAARAANSVSLSRAPYICTALTTADAGLAARVDRLLHPRHNDRPSGSSTVLALASLAIFAGAAACALSPWIYALSERLVHLGAG